MKKEINLDELEEAHGPLLPDPILVDRLVVIDDVVYGECWHSKDFILVKFEDGEPIWALDVPSDPKQPPDSILWSRQREISLGDGEIREP